MIEIRQLTHPELHLIWTIDLRSGRKNLQFLRQGTCPCARALEYHLQ